MSQGIKLICKSVMKRIGHLPGKAAEARIEQIIMSRYLICGD